MRLGSQWDEDENLLAAVAVLGYFGGTFPSTGYWLRRRWGFIWRGRSRFVECGLLYLQSPGIVVFSPSMMTIINSNGITCHDLSDFLPTTRLFGELEDALGPGGGEGVDPEWYLRPINLVKNQSVESIDDDKRLLNNKNTRGWPNSYWSQLYK